MVERPMLVDRSAIHLRMAERSRTDYRSTPMRRKKFGVLQGPGVDRLPEGVQRSFGDRLKERTDQHLTIGDGSFGVQIEDRQFVERTDGDLQAAVLRSTHARLHPEVVSEASGTPAPFPEDGFVPKPRNIVGQGADNLFDLLG